jgi:hypothetical protein
MTLMVYYFFRLAGHRNTFDSTKTVGNSAPHYATIYQAGAAFATRLPLLGKTYFPFFSPHLLKRKVVMKKAMDSFFTIEDSDFKHFNEDELAIIMGGGGEEPSSGFTDFGTLLPEEESLDF